MLRFVGFLTAVAGVFLLTAMERPEPASEVLVSITQEAAGNVRVVYQSRRPIEALSFLSVPGGYRSRRWVIDDDAFELQRFVERDRIERKDGKKFTRVEVLARPDLIRLPKEYQPVTPYGAGGAMVYTGHFWPVTKRGGRLNTTFDFTPFSDAHVVAFGSVAPRLENWRSPMAHPAFVYMGPLTPTETDHVLALVDPAAPTWVRDEFNALTPKIFDYFADVFGEPPHAKPNLFMSAPLGRNEGRLSFAGDALPAQFQITLEGGAWRERSKKGEDIFRRSTIHEAVHLWQHEARPGIAEEADWIHEGGADAVAIEAMSALGLWSASDISTFEREAKADCAEGLEDGSLATANDRGEFRALYACGYIVSVVSARAARLTASEFWRGFIDEAAQVDGYTADEFYDYVEDVTGNAEFRRAVRDFVETPLANPIREIDRLYAAVTARQQ